MDDDSYSRVFARPLLLWSCERPMRMDRARNCSPSSPDMRGGAFYLELPGRRTDRPSLYRSAARSLRGALRSMPSMSLLAELKRFIRVTDVLGIRRGPPIRR